MCRLYVVMGVAGSGKSLIGSMVAQAVDGTYTDGDDLHPQANIDKMSSGEPLTDDDRWPWLQSVATELKTPGGIRLIGCSALKKCYRDMIRTTVDEAVTFIYLDGSKELIAKRMSERAGHFMPTALLESQFAALEVPNVHHGTTITADATDFEQVITVDIDATPEAIVQTISEQIKNGEQYGK